MLKNSFALLSKPNLKVILNYKSQTYTENYPAIKIIAGTKCCFKFSNKKKSSRHLMVCHFVNESFHKERAARKPKNYASKESRWKDNNMNHVGSTLHLF